MSGTPLHAAVVGMGATTNGKGYWLVASDGGIFAFGDAPFLGSTGSLHLNKPIVGMAATPDGKGYWLVAADGGIFAFGDAPFLGSTGSLHLNKPIVGMAATADGKGYWLVASDGGVFSYGDAKFFGSSGGTHLDKPIVGMAATADGKGYWLVASDGGVFSYGDAKFYGSTGSLRLDAPIVGLATTADGKGYWLAASDGGVFSYGDAPFRGDASGDVPVGERITAIATGPGSGAEVAGGGDFTTPVISGNAPYAQGAIGYDISWPQCGGRYPPPAAVAVVGVNGGAAFSANPCFASEASWGGPNLSVYINVNSPQGSDKSQWGQGPAGNCVVGNLTCESYNYGYNTALLSITSANAAGHGSRTWWLDVETDSYWTSDTAANDQVIAGAVAAVHHSGYVAAIYSTNYQWGQIAGTYVPSVPAWYPTGVATPTPHAWCANTSFAGGPIYLVQRAAGSYDGDYSC
jgi:hypothetical protein